MTVLRAAAYILKVNKQSVNEKQSFCSWATSVFFFLRRSQKVVFQTASKTAKKKKAKKKTKDEKAKTEEKASTTQAEKTIPTIEEDDK